MGYADLIEKLRSLPVDKQAEVFDFVEFLASRGKPHGATSDRDDTAFSELSLSQALRGMEDDAVVYTADDVKERW